MPAYFRWGIGPFRFSHRLGQTQAQKRAAAKRRDARRFSIVVGEVRGVEAGRVLVYVTRREDNALPISIIGTTLRVQTKKRFEPGQLVALRLRVGDMTLGDIVPI